MKVVYREQADKDGRHRIHGAVLERDALLHEVSVNAPTLELEIDEIAANSALCQHLIRRRSQCDAAGHPKYAVDAGGNIVEKDGWEAWIDPEGGTPLPTLGPAVYSLVTVAVDAAKARLIELRDKPTLTVAEKDEALALVIEKQAMSATDARAL